MANYCNCSLVVTGSKEDRSNLYDKIMSLEKRDASLVENGWGKMWLGNLITILGGDWKSVRCKGTFDTPEYDYEDDVLRFNIMYAWVEPKEVIAFLKTKYSSLNFYFRAEEPGSQYYVTNDAKGEYFSGRYYFSEPDDCEPYYYEAEELEDFLRDVGKFVGKELKTAEEAKNAIQEYNEKVTDGIYAEIKIYKIIESV